jgi:hypothetical protein
VTGLPLPTYKAGKLISSSSSFLLRSTERNDESTPQLSSLVETSSTSSSDDISTTVEYYQNQAASLRTEIAQYEQQKRTEQEVYQQREQEKEDTNRYSALVPILKPDGTTMIERCTFNPIHPIDTSYISVIECNVPLGILIGLVEPTITSAEEGSTSNNNPRSDRPYIVIDDIAANSHGDKSELQVGDILHACTACRVDMELPTWQLLLGGIGRPKTNRYMYSIGATRRNTQQQQQQQPLSGSTNLNKNNVLEETMNAISSNQYDPQQRPVVLVIERRS